MVYRPSPVSEFKAVWIGQVELSGSIPHVAVPRRENGDSYERARILVRVHQQPLGFLELDVDENAIPVDKLLSAVKTQLGNRLDEHLARDGLSGSPLEPTGVPCLERPSCWSRSFQDHDDKLISVVISTRDRPDSLRPCLDTLLSVDDRYEVVVVDNAPRTGGTRQLVQRLGDPRVRYAKEWTPGLSAARNRGVLEARGELIAFTDDDVLVDHAWLAGLRLGWNRAPDVGCVTGMVPSAELETREQLIFETKVAWPRSCEARLFDLRLNRPADPLYPYIPGTFGAGANFAVTREALETVGNFDEALGAGSPAQGGEDLDFFLRVIRAGFRIAYEPAALVWHVHRRDPEALSRQLYGYGSGLSAFVTKQLLSSGTAPHVVRRLSKGVARGARSTREGNAGGVSRTLLARELVGLAAGPSAYLRGRWRTRGASGRGART